MEPTHSSSLLTGSWAWDPIPKAESSMLCCSMAGHGWAPGAQLLSQQPVSRAWSEASQRGTIGPFPALLGIEMREGDKMSSYPPLLHYFFFILVVLFVRQALGGTCSRLSHVPRPLLYFQPSRHQVNPGQEKREEERRPGLGDRYQTWREGGSGDRQCWQLQHLLGTHCGLGPELSTPYVVTCSVSIAMT
jgi:hypothetical protein